MGAIVLQLCSRWRMTGCKLLWLQLSTKWVASDRTGSYAWMAAYDKVTSLESGNLHFYTEGWIYNVYPAKCLETMTCMQSCDTWSGVSHAHEIVRIPKQDGNICKDQKWTSERRAALCKPPLIFSPMMRARLWPPAPLSFTLSEVGTCDVALQVSKPKMKSLCSHTRNRQWPCTDLVQCNCRRETSNLDLRKFSLLTVCHVDPKDPVQSTLILERIVASDWGLHYCSLFQN